MSSDKKLYYYYHFGRKENIKELVDEMNEFAKGLVTRELRYNPRLDRRETRLHCKHSGKLSWAGAYASRGDYIVYYENGDLRGVFDSMQFKRLFGGEL